MQQTLDIIIDTETMSIQELIKIKQEIRRILLEIEYELEIRKKFNLKNSSS